ncbi:hypothetical protein [Kitasatospora sp. NPDC002965]|uniref:hypothetical protein n=1 Tax=Kitasatospora sp. NPDC002965 TaxID=3154775 RepID=UPI0033B66F25
MSAADELPRLDGAQKYAGVAHRIYRDRRAAPPAKELLLAVAYALFVAPGVEEGRVLGRAAQVLGRDAVGQPRYDRLVADDAPRYEPPCEAGDWGPSQAPGCEAPRIRPYEYRPRNAAPAADEAVVPLRRPPAPVLHVPAGYVPPIDFRNERGICGADSHHRVLELDPRTGWTIAHWYCRRHADHAERVTEQLRDQNAAAPPPIPNTGGLLPVYFRAPWEGVYRRHAPATWKPPAYGLSADDWPDPGNPPLARPRRLRAL